jgi:carbohydrate-binding DOMON domain-containing protein
LAAEATISSRRLLGPEHPTSEAAAYNLREILREYSATAEEWFTEGDFARALAIFEEILALMTEIFGEDDPETEVTRENVATTQEALTRTQIGMPPP